MVRLYFTYALILLFVLTVGVFLLTVRPFVFSVEKIVLPANAKPLTLRAHVEKLANEFYPRNWQHLENLDQSAAYIADTFRAYGFDPEFQEYQVGEQRYKNVIVSVKNSEAPPIVIGAHYDSFSDTPGADDNASGVAGLLELGRLISENPINKNVLLVAYTLEEPPFFRTKEMGSAVHAMSLRRAGKRIELMISLEMIGHFSEEVKSQTYPLPFLGWYYPSRGNYIAIVDSMNLGSVSLRLKRAFLEATNIPVYSFNAVSLVPGVDYSDHFNYWNAGYKAVMVTDTAFMRNDNYHTAHDSADTLDYQKMAQVVDGVYHFLN